MSRLKMGLVGCVVIVLCVALLGCGKKEEPPVVVVEPSTKEKMDENAKEFKKTADATAVEVGHAFKNFGTQVGDAFKKADQDLRDK